MTLYANTTSYANENGAITTGIYTEAELKQLTKIAHGDQYTGNSNFDRVVTEHVYKNGNTNYMNVVGADGVLKLYNDSKYLPKAAQAAVSGFWNHVAGVEIVRFVDTVEESDEVIHDVAGDTGVLAAQSYNGDGLIFYPDSWHIDKLTAEQQENWHMTALIHEIGHGLGLSHLGGGVDGANAGNAGRFGSELMGPWDVTDHPEGPTSTMVDAAALAVAALTWRKPRKIAAWILQTDASKKYVRYNNRQLVSNLPVTVLPAWGVKFDQAMIRTPVVTYRKIDKNYNLYRFDDKQIDGVTLYTAPQVGYTGQPDRYLIGKTVQILEVYPTNMSGQRVVRFKYNDEGFTMYEAALDRKV
ncbi:hypothetical protein [Weissella viridescens]|uniref:hypothetical protein n=1 Tax=Weissella viridescens TaxID=1629 RepID=UPI00092F7572|nr:hypothetical protein [Weissella viridescens]